MKQLKLLSAREKERELMALQISFNYVHQHNYKILVWARKNLQDYIIPEVLYNVQNTQKIEWNSANNSKKQNEQNREEIYIYRPI